MRTRRNPATVAGLTGAALLAAPASAQAATLDEVAASFFTNPYASFIAGVVVGAAVSGVACGVACHALLRADKRRAEEAQELRLLYGEPAEKDLDSWRMARALADDSEPQARSAAARPAAARPAAARGGKHFKAPAPEPSEAPSAAPTRRPVSHAATDYEDIAQNYVAKSRRKKRLATRAQGVAATLRARMGASKMDGLPVITRADGSVADVGTEWWNTSVGLASITKVEDYVKGDTAGSLAIPSDFASSDKDQLVEAARSAASEFTKKGISERVAFVDEGDFPERRDASRNTADDDWASALRSMDERLGTAQAAPAPAQAVAFLDIVGDAETLDEPDGLEQPTSFIPFKTPAGHPEVVDTESYVDYLIGEEFSRNSSKAARAGAGRFLHLIEGGGRTAELGHREHAGASRRSAEAERPRAKHFAPEALAQEA